MTCHHRVFLFAALVLAVGPGTVEAANVQMTIPQGYFARNIGKSSLTDPSGATHTRQDVAGKVVVAIFSDPTMSQGGAQEKWSDLLATQSDTKLPNEVALVLVEDMSEAGMFKGIALGDMKKQFAPHQRPFLILDQTGDVFKKFGVPRNTTCILTYDKKGKLRDVEVDLNDQATVIGRIKAITKELLAD